METFRQESLNNSTHFEHTCVWCFHKHRFIPTFQSSGDLWCMLPHSCTQLGREAALDMFFIFVNRHVHICTFTQPAAGTSHPPYQGVAAGRKCGNNAAVSPPAGRQLCSCLPFSQCGASWCFSATSQLQGVRFQICL